MKSERRCPRNGGLSSALALALVAGLGLTACGDDGGTGPSAPEVASVVVVPTTIELTSLGEAQQLTANALDANGDPISGKTFSWSSGDPGVASVDASSGLVTAVDNGEVTITAQADGVPGTAAVTVADPVGVGPNGNTVSVAGGDVLLEFPPGALSESVTITAEPSSTFPGSVEVIEGTVYEFGPDGTQFAQPVQLTISYDPNELPGWMEESSLALHTVEGDTWQPVAGSSADIQANTVTGSISSFSVFGIRGVVPLDEICGTEESVPASECAALVALYLDTGGDEWTDNTGWMSSSDPCGWYGISCIDGQVSAVELIENGLVGPIPVSLSDLTGLAELILVANQLTGTIPPALGGLSSLTNLFLASNQLSGPIPVELGNLSGLIRLDVAGNPLASPIPPELGNLASLAILDLGNTQSIGAIPPELGNLANLGGLDLGVNQLTGPIPPELGNLGNLDVLWAADNQLTGVIPPELGSLSNLSTLELAHNQLTGDIPPELGDLSGLGVLNLRDNRLTGSIPAELGSLSNLLRLELALNQLTGDIPPELGSLSKLSTLDLRDNRLTGSIPAELGSLSNLGVWHLQNNQLSGLVPLAAAELGAEVQQPNPPQCNFQGNEDLFILDSQDYLDADLDGDGFICGVPLTQSQTRAVVGRWEVTSYVVDGTDLIAGGMTMTAALTDVGVYLLAVTNDVTDLCEDEETDCTLSGPLAVTEKDLTFDPPNGVTVGYTIDGSGMTWAFTDGGIPVTLTLSKVEYTPAVPAVVGRWEATSLLADGTDLIAGGMTLTMTTTDLGVFLLAVTNDLTDLCEVDEGETACARSGPYTATDTQITFQHPEDGFTAGYTIDGSVMTFTFTDEGIPITITLSKVG